MRRWALPPGPTEENLGLLAWLLRACFFLWAETALTSTCVGLPSHTRLLLHALKTALPHSGLGVMLVVGPILERTDWARCCRRS